MNTAERLALKVKENGLHLFSVAYEGKDGKEKACVFPANPCNNSYSVAKAFIVTAIGLLWEAGKIRPEDKVTELLERHLPSRIDPRYKDVTVEHLLTHKAGYDRGFLDIDAEDITKYPDDDFIKLALSEPIVHTPGTHFCYTDAAFYLLSVIVTELTGKRADDFLRPLLFQKLGFHEMAWGICPRGYTIGATGLFLRTEDMVKLGSVYANDGMYGEERILSPEWVELVLSRGYEFHRVEDTDLYAKGGMRGQMLCFSRKRRFACAWHGYETRDTRSAFAELLREL